MQQDRCGQVLVCDAGVQGLPNISHNAQPAVAGVALAHPHAQGSGADTALGGGFPHADDAGTVERAPHGVCVGLGPDACRQQGLQLGAELLGRVAHPVSERAPLSVGPTASAHGVGMHAGTSCMAPRGKARAAGPHL